MTREEAEQRGWRCDGYGLWWHGLFDGGGYTMDDVIDLERFKDFAVAEALEKAAKEIDNMAGPCMDDLIRGESAAAAIRSLIPTPEATR